MTAVRSCGLWAGVDLAPAVASGRQVSEALLAQGVLSKETQRRTLRLAPPLVIEDADLDAGLDALARVVDALVG